MFTISKIKTSYRNTGALNLLDSKEHRRDDASTKYVNELHWYSGPGLLEEFKDGSAIHQEELLLRRAAR